MGLNLLFERIQGGATDGIETHGSKYYKKGFYYCRDLLKEVEGLIIDPFARNCMWGDIRNDIDPKIKTVQYNLESLVFMKKIKTSSAKLVLFDPPFSSSQSEKYEAGDTNLYCTGDGRIGKLCREVERILKPGGIMLKLGYNSSRPSKNFNLLKVYVVNFGGTRNDVLMTIWQKNTTTLDQFMASKS